MPVHNGGDAFRACAAALLESLGPRDELIVVADGATDGAWRDLAGTRAHVLVGRESRGPGHARNRGARTATGEVLFFVDADVVVRPDTLEAVRRAFAEGPALDALVGSYDDAPGDSGFVSQYRNLLHHFVHQRGGGAISTFWGACGAVRREAFLSVGGFDESYREPSVEDVELGYRMAEAGYEIRLDPSLQVTHLKRWTAASVLRTDVFARAAPWTELLLQRGAVENGPSLGVAARLSTAAVCALPALGVAALWVPGPALAAGAGALAVTVALNAPFYAFLRRARGPLFALRAVPWHLAYFASSGLGFAVGLARYMARPTPPAPSVREQYV